MSTYMPDEMKRYKHLLESISTEGSVGMNPTHALSDKELDRFQQMPATKQKIASPDQQGQLDSEMQHRSMDEEFDVMKCEINGRPVNVRSIEVDGSDRSHEQSDAYASYAEFDDGTPLTHDELDQLTDNYAEAIQDIASQNMWEGQDITDEGNEFSGARQAAIDVGKDEFTVGDKTYKVSETEALSEGPADNFTIDDIKKLESLPSLEDMKAYAKELISTPSRRPMKPQKVMYLTQSIDSKKTPNALIKLMYDLLLGGEGHLVIGSRRSMDPNIYRKTFGEDSVDESVTTNQFEEPKGHASQSKPNWNKAGTTSQNYSKGQTKDWDSYMSNESEHESNENYSASEQRAWDKKGSNESVNWDEMVSEAKADLAEKWAGDTQINPKKTGMFAGKTKAELQKSYNKLKTSGPHKASSADNTKMKELAFAIRAKGDWGKVNESVATPPVVDNSEENAILDRIRQLSGLK